MHRTEGNAGNLEHAGQAAGKLGIDWVGLEHRVDTLVESMYDSTLSVEDETYASGEIVSGNNPIDEKHSAFRKLISSPLGSATKKTMHNKVRDFDKYLHFAHGVSSRSVTPDTLMWPPGKDVWIEFIYYARNEVTSFQRLQNLLHNVVTAGCAMKGVPTESNSPMKLYCREHKKALNVIRRDHDDGVEQVQGITMQECQSFHMFVDKFCLQGLQDAGLFAFGCASIRRPRSVTSIKIKDLQVVVEQVKLSDGSTAYVPAFTASIRDEKFMDSFQGVRGVRDMLQHMRNYDEFCYYTFSYWLYTLMVFRGAFQSRNPLENARLGDKLQFKNEAAEWYLFCQVQGDVFNNAMPLGVQQLGESTKAILKAMNRPLRGYSAHRKGGATRAIITSLLKSHGKSIGGDIELLLLRWGGWDIMRGLETLRRRYEQKIIDECIDRYFFSFGRDSSAVEWEARLKDYMQCMPPPASPPICRTSTRVPFILKINAVMDVEYQIFLNKLSHATMIVLNAAKCDYKLNPISRYQSDREAMMEWLGMHPSRPEAVGFKLLRAQQFTEWHNAVNREKQRCALAFVKHCTNLGYSDDVGVIGVDIAMQHLVDTTIPAWVRQPSNGKLPTLDSYIFNIALKH